jgi:hypothetical protein
MTATQDLFSKPTKVSAAQKSEETNTVARSIIAQETAARDRKTEKLRALRLAKEGAAPTPLPGKKRRQGRAAGESISSRSEVASASDNAAKTGI